MDKLEQYLEQVCRSIGGPRSLRQHVRQELREHLRNAVAQHQAAGLSEEEALDRALADFGGPDEVKSELEATHGHRLLPVVIDKAMQWKEMTMRARWLWMSWTYVALICVIILELLTIGFSWAYLVPKMKKLREDGLLDRASAEPAIEWLYGFMNRVDWVLDQGTWLMLGLLTLWGLFEWRVRSENKAFMRLSVLGTGALGLMVVVFLVLCALVLPPMLYAPMAVKLAQPFAAKQIAAIDTSLAALEKAIDAKDWKAAQEHSSDAVRAYAQLIDGLPGLVVRPDSAFPQVKAHYMAAKEFLREVERAAMKEDAIQLKAAMQKFRDAYEPLREAAKRPAK